MEKMSRALADTGKPRSGKFSGGETMREKQCKALVAEDMDWTSTAGKIWVRCWETPDMFTLVEADIVWRSPVMRVK